jgi:hypothetical protein
VPVNKTELQFQATMQQEVYKENPGTPLYVHKILKLKDWILAGVRNKYAETLRVLQMQEIKQ